MVNLPVVGSFGFVCCDINDSTFDNLFNIMQFLIPDYELQVDSHVKLITDSRNPKIFYAPNSRLMKAKAIGFAQYPPDNPKKLVVELESKDLLDRHNELLSYGFKHTFEEYKPHLTLGKAINESKLKTLDVRVLPELYFLKEHWNKFKE
jgi:hypothetical protein